MNTINWQPEVQVQPKHMPSQPAVPMPRPLSMLRLPKRLWKKPGLKQRPVPLPVPSQPALPPRQLQLMPVLSSQPAQLPRPLQPLTNLSTKPRQPVIQPKRPVRQPNSRLSRAVLLQPVQLSTRLEHWVQPLLLDRPECRLKAMQVPLLRPEPLP